MKKFFAAFLLLPFLSQAQQGFTISGNVEGFSKAEVKLTTSQNPPTIVLADSIRDGKFVLQGSLPEPGLYMLNIGDEPPQYIYLDHSNISVAGKKGDFKNLSITGSTSHADFIEFNQIFNPMFAELNALAAQLQKANSERKAEGFQVQYDSVISVINSRVGEFVNAKRSSFVSPFLLWVTAQVNPDPMNLEERFNLLDENIRNSEIGKSLKDYIAYQKVGAVGTDAIEFTQNDVEDKPLSLSSFRGKYVLVDFWASWCKPCRLENPHVVKVYNNYKDENFTIIGVSLDQQKAAWLKAIDADKLNWYHVSDLQSWDNAVAKMYHIQSIPGNFLIDPNGKIIAKDLRGEDLQRELEKIFGAPKKNN